mmetsp:Transcript_15517/g.29629  ORF Transcript_15517/g.29629 Transcript_15517/m.29629 type:complete len:278 (-) Transcript_15517:1611-2444(-)
MQGPQMTIGLGNNRSGTRCGVHKSQLTKRRVSVHLARTLVHVHSISTFASCVFFAVWQNSDLEITLVDNVEPVSHGTLFDHPGAFLDGDRLHTGEDHLTLLIVDATEHHRRLDSFRNALLLFFCLFRSKFLPVKVDIFRISLHVLGLFLELGNLLGLFLRNLLTNRLETLSCEGNIVHRVVIVGIQARIVCTIHASRTALIVVDRDVSKRRAAVIIHTNFVNENTNNGNIIGSKFILQPQFVSFRHNGSTGFEGVAKFGADINNGLIRQKLVNAIRR